MTQSIDTHKIDTYGAERREVLGKKVKRLRRAGTIPGNVFGRGLSSIAVQMPAREARSLLVAHGTNSLVRLQVDGEDEARPVTVRNVQRHPVDGAVLHLDFYQVDLSRTMTATVPVHVVGDAPAVQMYQGVLLQGADTIHVEALPADIPMFLEVSVDGLAELEEQVTVADLVVPEGLTITSEPGLMLARVARPRLIVEDELAVPEGEEAPEGEEVAEGEEAAAPADQAQEKTD